MNIILFWSLHFSKYKTNVQHMYCVVYLKDLKSSKSLMITLEKEQNQIAR